MEVDFTSRTDQLAEWVATWWLPPWWAQLGRCLIIRRALNWSSASPVGADRKEAAADRPVSRCQGAEGARGPPGEAGVWNGLPLPASGPAPRLPALCQDEICSYHWTARAGGKDQARGRAAQMSQGEPTPGAQQFLILSADCHSIPAWPQWEVLLIFSSGLLTSKQQQVSDSSQPSYPGYLLPFLP